MSIPIAKPYIASFEQMGMGLFIHWGLYSQLGRGEWIYLIDKMEKSDYEPLAQTFTAAEFDADALARLAKAAGCRYITMTTRHHDGFSLYDTKGLSEFDCMHSAAGRDLVQEFVDGCRRYDVVPFFYHTTLDWHHEAFQDNFPVYLDYLQRSVELLCTNYGKIGGFWFDGNWSKPEEDWKEAELYGMIRRLQPEAVIINNTGVFARGEAGGEEIDAVTFEQGNPEPLNQEGAEKYRAAEMCDTMSELWGYGELDLNFKPPKQMIEDLCGCRKAGANYLLNIGLTGGGSPSEMQTATLNILGKWMDIFGEAIYEGRPCGCVGIGKNFALAGKDALYLFCFDVGKVGDLNNGYEGWYSFSNVPQKAKRITWMDNGKDVRYLQSGDMLGIYIDKYPYGVSTCVRVARVEL